ncbi:alpha/beta hydrolase [Tuanshanicoccus lijuaniae]|uniref:alpha/beta hydrolase n=1 Tax=Aerococcaceae bacterium zg-1292 TaxID=2774330 RepID=UPI00193587AF|nr:alpha/beta hydrolase [Aerococcaceae bacterium zg-1292]QQA37028.1 alpha/beta hydrolase [Aerococcaceae bacterium zg-1292]
MNGLIWIIVGMVIILLVAYIVTSIRFSRNIALPNVSSLEKEMQWEKEHHLWGDFDSYEKKAYTVKGYQDYQLNVVLVKAAVPSDKYVIISHGYTANRYGAVKYLDAYRNQGYHVIIYDVRGHGDNKKVPVSLGYFEAKDLIAIIEDTYARYGQDIYLGLHGESMGSSISLNALAYKPKVKFVVADCGFTNLYELIEGLYRQHKAGLLIFGVNWMMRLIQGFNMKATSAIDALKENEVPVMFIHGKNDTFIFPEHSEKLAAANHGKSVLHLVERATHAGSRQTLGMQAYTALIRDFLEGI